MIKTWQQRCEEHPDHEGIVSDGMVQARMQEEIDDLREALEEVEELREALKAALAEPVQEPVAWMHTNGVGHVYFRKKPQDKVFNPQPVYLHPKTLTDEDISVLWHQSGEQPFKFARMLLK